ncbi:MAG: hypothetical protein Q7J55_00590 [bacterium]|nr:hypothetical protein [bacterium]
MSKKTLVVLISMVFLATLAFAGTPDVSYHGLWYTYSFFWKNADFVDTTSDGDQHYYMHGDISCDADFGAGIGTHVTIGAWGTYGRHAITYAGPEAQGEGAELMEAYLTASNLFDSPISFRVGKEHVCYGDQVFDGGEDGFMGAKLSYGSDMLDVDIFSYRLIEGGGTNWIGTVIGTEVPDDWDLHGVWATAKLGNINLSPYGFYRTIDKNSPMWVGVRSDGSLIEGFNYAAEFATMMGKNEDVTPAIDYKGMHYMGRLGYTPPGMPLTVGGAYVAFSGDDPTTVENELYESPTWGGYTFGFYKAWPGFGPAHLMRTAYGFALLAPPEEIGGPTNTNLNVINGNVGYTAGPLALRADFFMYSRNKVAAGAETAMGNEIALMLTYNYKETITFGATGGYWIPGKVFTGEDPMLGGYLWTAMSF